MHGEQAIENLGRNKIVVRADQLDAHDGGFDSTDKEENQREDNVKNAQALVIDGGHPLM
jgi:hypothetical protein